MSRMSIGYDKTTNLLWLIGGNDPNSQSLISFNLSIWNETTAIIDHSESTLPTWIRSLGQAYVQKAHIVYVIDYNNSNLLAFDVSTQALNTIITNSSVNVYSWGCLASIGDWIIYTSDDKMYILTISTQTWKSEDHPQMLELRDYHSCMIEPNEGYLYVIGGSSKENPFSVLDSIEKLYVNDIANLYQYNFTSLTEPLSKAKYLARSILYKTDIYVIGGGDIFVSYDDIDVIDTTTDSVTLWGRMSDSIEGTSPILIGTRVYMFGGEPSVFLEPVNYWQYFDVFSISICI